MYGEVDVVVAQPAGPVGARHEAQGVQGQLQLGRGAHEHRHLRGVLSVTQHGVLLQNHSFPREIQFVYVAQIIGFAILFTLGEEQPTMQTKYVVGLKLGHENVLEGAAALAQAGPVARVLCEPDLLQQLHLLIVFVHLSQTFADQKVH